MAKKKIESDYDISWRYPFKKKIHKERFYTKQGKDNFVKQLKKHKAQDIKVKERKY